jgi:hypothetical protein
MSEGGVGLEACINKYDTCTSSTLVFCLLQVKVEIWVEIGYSSLLRQLDFPSTNLSSS